MVVDVGRVVERLAVVSRARGNTAARTGRAHGAVVRARDRCREAVEAQLLAQRAYGLAVKVVEGVSVRGRAERDEGFLGGEQGGVEVALGRGEGAGGRECAGCGVE